MKLLVDVALNNRVMKLLVDVALKFLNLCTAMVVMVANIASYPGLWPPTENLGSFHKFAKVFSLKKFSTQL